MAQALAFETRLTPLMDQARSVLEAATDIDESATVDSCHRVIDCCLQGSRPASADLRAVFTFFK